jgi:hypothetical protein
MLRRPAHDHLLKPDVLLQHCKSNQNRAVAFMQRCVEPTGCPDVLMQSCKRDQNCEVAVMQRCAELPGCPDVLMQSCTDAPRQPSLVSAELRSVPRRPSWLCATYSYKSPPHPLWINRIAVDPCMGQGTLSLARSRGAEPLVLIGRRVW